MGTDSGYGRSSYNDHIAVFSLTPGACPMTTIKKS